jgi:AcrR family transcriptional regulator
MALAAERPWEDVTLEALAERAGVTLSALRAAYDGRVAVLADYVRSIDEKVLAGLDAGLANEAPREKLFDLLFARFEALAAHREAVRSLGRAARRDPLFALELNRIVATSMVWMLAAAGIPAHGVRGMLRAQALALIWSRVIGVWLDDDDAGLARTMAALDKELRRAERAAMQLDWLRNCLGRPLRSTAGSRGDGPASELDLSEGHPS